MLGTAIRRQTCRGFVTRKKISTSKWILFAELSCVRKGFLFPKFYSIFVRSAFSLKGIHFHSLLCPCPPTPLNSVSINHLCSYVFFKVLFFYFFCSVPFQLLSSSASIFFIFSVVNISKGVFLPPPILDVYLRAIFPTLFFTCEQFVQFPPADSKS